MSTVHTVAVTGFGTGKGALYDKSARTQVLPLPVLSARTGLAQATDQRRSKQSATACGPVAV